MEFEKRVQALLDSPDIEAALETLEFYKGEYLPYFNTEDWVITKQSSLAKIYESLYRKTFQALLEQQAYQQAYSLAVKAAAIYPFDEYQVDIINCLLAMNSYGKAFQLYTDTTELYFKEMGLEPSERMREQLERMNDPLHNLNISIDKILNVLNGDEMNGSYYCSLPGFMDAYRFVRRFIGRTGQCAYVVIIMLEDANLNPLNPDDERTKTVSEILKTTIRNSLRSGDIFTSYNPVTYILLLMCADDEGCDVVTQRIRNNLKKQNNYKRMRISFQKSAVTDKIVPCKRVTTLYGNQEVCICIDKFNEYTVGGRSFNRFDREPACFRSFGELFLQLNEFYDRIGFPQTDRQMRPQSDQKKASPGKTAGIPLFSAEEIMKHRGGAVTFVLKVVRRQNLTWQGFIEPVDTDWSMPFSSEIQLIQNMTEYMRKGNKCN